MLKTAMTAVTLSMLLGVVSYAQDIPPNVSMSSTDAILQNEIQIFFCPIDSNIVVANWR